MLLLASSTIAGAQSLEDQRIRLSILADTLTTTSDKHNIHIPFSVQNNSDKNVILYELMGSIGRDQFGAMWPYCQDDKKGAAIILFAFDSLCKPVTAIHWYVNDLKRPMTGQRFDSIMSADKETYLARTLLLGKYQINKFKREIDLEEFHLKKGQYFIQLLYFSGIHIRHFVTDGEILRDKKAFNAEVFQGCLTSNKSVLLVE